MASKAASSVPLLLLTSFAASASAATITIMNNCSYKTCGRRASLWAGARSWTQARRGPSTCPPAPAAVSVAAPAVPSTGKWPLRHRRLRWCALLHPLWSAARNATRPWPSPAAPALGWCARTPSALMRTSIQPMIPRPIHAAATATTR